MPFAGILIQSDNSTYMIKTSAGRGRNQVRVAAKPIPLINTIKNAFLIPWQRRKVLVPVLVIPAIVLVALRTLELRYGEKSFLFLFLLIGLDLLVLTVFAVICHRLILLGPKSVGRSSWRSWTMRETRFLGWSLLFCFFLMISALVFSGLLPILFNLNYLEIMKSKFFPDAFFYPTYLAWLYFFCRWGILLPATAVNKKYDLRWAWRKSKGNEWRLFILVGLLPQAIYFLPGHFLDKESPILLIVLIMLLTVTLAVVEISTLSLSYKALIGKTRR